MHSPRRSPFRRLLPLSLLALVTVSPAAGCGDDAVAPRATIAEELTGGNGPFLASLDGVTAPAGYELHEYVAEGDAVSYRQSDFGLPDDGRWSLRKGTTAHYRTRVVVRRPSDPSLASGTVVMEWLNVSGGVDADADYASLVEEIVRQGHVWVGVSAQIIGVEGGQVLISVGGLGGDYAGKGLKAIDPARYGSLVHPGDGFAFDIFTQIARTIREGGDLLGGVVPDVVIAAGESQSAMALTTYYDGVQIETEAFDGFFIHSRGAFTLPLVEPGQSADLLAALMDYPRPILRDDLAAPAIIIQTEGDTIGTLRSSAVRQPDSATVRTWEVAGTAHADRHLLGAAAEQLDCPIPINDGPMHVVTKAAFRALETWVREGTAPVSGSPVQTQLVAGTPAIVRDADGIALGGIRTPPVDVPVDVLSGDPQSSSLICLLMGTTTTIEDARIAELYESRAQYEQRFTASADASIAAGFVLQDDRAALLAYMKPSRVQP